MPTSMSVIGFRDRMPSSCQSNIRAAVDSCCRCCQRVNGRGLIRSNRNNHVIRTGRTIRVRCRQRQRHRLCGIGDSRSRPFCIFDTGISERAYIRTGCPFEYVDMVVPGFMLVSGVTVAASVIAPPPSISCGRVSITVVGAP